MRKSPECRRAALICLLAVSVLLLAGPPAPAQSTSSSESARSVVTSGGSSSAANTSSSTAASPGAETARVISEQDPEGLLQGIGGPEEWTKPERLSSTLQVMLLMTVISLAPAVLLMTTSFVRVIVVLALLRQALGTQQAPPGQVITSIALFITLLLMTPVWKESYDQGVKPYTEGQLSLDEAFAATAKPIRTFMADQITRTGNHDDVRMFLQRLPDELDPQTGEPFADYDYVVASEGVRVVPLAALLPGYMLSELKTAFLIGFQVYLPFVILDIVVASITISMGMLMLPPVLISLPFKLLLFVLVDGWRLVVEMLLESFTIYL
ncbi:flagellar type III secretion system pore protein FliP [Botrimarina hoheduenensis]|uniref:Flagellar biosynthetic protein FliP n=1 Tax=Botrimarina hoheduenensis TaxID=2528000 RepID=A0A5C5VYT1_9BACT|nr:flagellar type III secretion system pore protein FliP [Botrimarina hoheduenensis]TWT43195.1 Flagellar biosynthetic protein FliP precursor [Botrimarina hoheduenensis]